MERLEIQLLSTPEFNYSDEFGVRILINDKETFITELSQEHCQRIAGILQNAKHSFDNLAKGKQPERIKAIKNKTMDKEQERISFIWELVQKIVPNKNLQTIEVKEFTDECVKMIELYSKKNHDYGNSFEQGMNAIGPAYGIGRLYDKMNRILTLMSVKAEITDESIEDTIRDLACYAVMTSCYIDLAKKNVIIKDIDDVQFE